MYLETGLLSVTPELLNFAATLESAWFVIDGDGLAAAPMFLEACWGCLGLGAVLVPVKLTTWNKKIFNKFSILNGSDMMDKSGMML